MKNIVLVLLVIVGLYWLFDHHAPFPLSHDSLGLYNHTIHRVIGVVCLALAGFFTWSWKFRK